jgi:hypothetical protein
VRYFSPTKGDPMKFIPLFLLLSVTAFAAPKLPFCDMSVLENADPSDTSSNSLYDSRDLRYTEKVRFTIPKNVYAANKSFFGKSGHSCLTMGIIELAVSGEKYLAYRTTKDECDGGNTFGIIVSKKTGKKVADISDGDIMCKK